MTDAEPPSFARHFGIRRDLANTRRVSTSINRSQRCRFVRVQISDGGCDDRARMLLGAISPSSTASPRRWGCASCCASTSTTASRSSSEVPSSAEATTSGAGKSATRVPPPSIPGTRPGPAGVAAVAGLQPLLIPVQGVGAAQLQDTFTDSRAQGRSHEAIDIMAPAGTPVLAVADGTVEKLFTSDAGGLTVYQFEPSGRYAYYYAHLQGYAPGLAEKQALRRGDVIGYVGSTGNANPLAPHLHFAVFELGPERRWWQGTAINPYPLLHRP